jgi:lactate dehydrogenase-like 2-hydroxyacid dehydrogenase
MSLSRRNIATGRLSSTSVPSLAIVDDHLNTSTSHFANIPSSKLRITTFNDTIVPVNEREENRLINRLCPFDLISTIRERTAFSGSLLRQLPNLKLLLATGTQFEMFDLEAARELGIAVVAAPGRGRSDQPAAPDIRIGSVHPTTQHTWAMILALARNVAADDAALKAGRSWQSGLAMGLPTSTIGVIGLGRLGAAVARVAHLAWGMRVVCWSANLTQEKADQMAVAVGLPTDGGPESSKTFQAVSKEDLPRHADIVSMHYVLSDRSRKLIGGKELEMMKPSALLVNTARGALIDQDALVDTLEHGRIKGAALDVFELEPLPLDSPWRKVDYWGTNGRARLLTTPHMGYVDEALMNNWYAETAENVERWLQGKDVLHRLA